MDAAILTEFDADVTAALVPGAYLLALGGIDLALKVRLSGGFQLQDSFAIFFPGPSFRSAFLFRKTLPSTVIEQVLQLGVGPLNIDGCRVPGEAKVPWGKIRAYRVFHDQSQDGPACIDAPPANPLGRWPPNVCFVHGTGCTSDGSKWACAGSCPMLGLPTTNDDIQELFPQFPNEVALLVWLRKLITPPTGVGRAS